MMQEGVINIKFEISPILNLYAILKMVYRV